MTARINRTGRRERTYLLGSVRKLKNGPGRCGIKEGTVELSEQVEGRDLEFARTTWVRIAVFGTREYGECAG